MKRVKFKLDEVLKKNGNLTQKQIAEMIGVRPEAINELFIDHPRSIKKDHLQKIAEALNINDITEIMELEDVEQ
ncbi:helix-turn-helix domain-containing protein [Cytobacillus sp. NCCP-133]|uniref:helix-turn-helix domain-containing protein n=1 Tax=Cytobacillus sp. NCCP-133 TaxID=766848 RepID=UPI002231F0A2|nr:helix-turn-helix transcriptional regulator [Cytobacillus sp. NCCP-133]GLB61991.1 hypothetical protein NCCP133_41200 [Cytobacillus sp. NCCP-133]